MSELHVYYSSLTWQQYKQQPIVWKASLVAQRLKRLPPMRETRIWSLSREDSPEEEMGTQSSILAWKTPWTVEPSRLQSTGSQRTGHDWATEHEPKGLICVFWRILLWSRPCLNLMNQLCGQKNPEYLPWFLRNLFALSHFIGPKSRRNDRHSIDWWQICTQ